MNRLIFFGTPEFAVPTLRALCQRGFAPVLVVTQPPRPQGRHRRVQQPPVAQWAAREQLPLAQPADVRDREFLEGLHQYDPTMAVVVAFGQIFPKALLELPAKGCVNVHASLLPRYRGAAPIQAAIMAGDGRTGVTTMLMDEGLDTGPILLQRELAIGAIETAGELSERLAVLGGTLLVETLEVMGRGDLEPRRQLEGEASTARRLHRRDGVLDWTCSAEVIFNRLRGLTPWPGVSTMFRGKPLKILWGEPIRAGERSPGEPGSILGIHQGRLWVTCGAGSVFGIERLQKPGRKALVAKVFANGERLEEGERLG